MASAVFRGRAASAPNRVARRSTAIVSIRDLSAGRIVPARTARMAALRRILDFIIYCSPLLSSNANRPLTVRYCDRQIVKYSNMAVVLYRCCLYHRYCSI